MSATVESTPAVTAELAAEIADRPDDELRATVRLLHRAYASRVRLGWDDALRGQPVLLAAMCLTITCELVRRGSSAFACAPCAATVIATMDARAGSSFIPAELADEIKAFGG